MKIYNYKDRLARFGYKYFDTILKNLEIIKISEKVHDFSRGSMSTQFCVMTIIRRKK